MALKRIGSYIVTSQCLGTGSFATVHLALDPDNHRQVACKSIRTKKESEIAQVMKEVRILMTLKHVSVTIILFFPNVDLQGWFSSPTSMKSTIQRKTKNSCLRFKYFGDFYWHIPTVTSSFSSVLVGTFSLTSRMPQEQGIAYVKPRPSISCINSLRHSSICTTNWYLIEASFDTNFHHTIGIWHFQGLLKDLKVCHVCLVNYQFLTSRSRKTSYSIVLARTHGFLLLISGWRDRIRTKKRSMYAEPFPTCPQKEYLRWIINI